MPSPTTRRARLGATSAFATNGAIPTSFFARYAEVKDALDLNPATFGLLVVGFAVGAAAALNLPGIILRRFGDRITTSVGTAGIALALIIAALGVHLANPWVVLAGLLAAGFSDAVVDIAQNSQGLQVQNAYGRSVLTSMHAGWSVGALIGGAVGTAAATLGVPIVVQLVVWGGIGVTSMALSSKLFLRSDSVVTNDVASGGPLRIGAFKLLVPLVLVALAGISIEDVGNNWAAVLLSTEKGVAVTSAGIGLTAVLGAQFIGRLLGDRFIDLVGQRTALLVSLLAGGIGLTTAAWAPSAGLALVGLALAGLGCAITVPIAFARADEIPGLPPHAGVTWVGFSMRVTTIGLTPAIGVVAGASTLPVALTVLAVFSVVALVVVVRSSSPRSVQ